MEIDLDTANIETIRLFGSFARGDQSIYSDYDILVILKKSQIISEALNLSVKKLFEREISISWYSIEKIKHLYRMGHLFAWHLHLESKQLHQNDFLTRLGEPAKYTYSYQDINSLLEILYPIKEEVAKNPRNIVYETGLVYVCVRNIAICALPVLKNKICFSTQVPFKLDLELNMNDYDLLMKCRYSSTRGFDSPKIGIMQFNRIYHTVLLWGKNLLMQVATQKQQ